MIQNKKDLYQKRSLAINRLSQFFEEFQEIPLAQLLCVLTSHIGETNPFKWDDNTLIGKIEHNSQELRRDYKVNWEEMVEDEG